MRLTIAALITLALISGGYAQTTPAGDDGLTTPPGEGPEYPLGLTEQASCWLGSMRFSPGAAIRSGGSVMVCEMDFTWQPHEGDAAGCIRGGELHAVGDVQKLASSATVVTCGADGTWTAKTE